MRANRWTRISHALKQQWHHLRHAVDSLTPRRLQLAPATVGRLRRVRRHSHNVEPLEARMLLDVSGLLITEFMAVNNTTLADGSEPPAYPDWIEIHNPTPDAVSLDGGYLTDTATNLTRWQLPPITIAGGEYMVFFASSPGVDDYQDPGGNYHANFKLGGGGEYLALVQMVGEVPTVIQEFVSAGGAYPDQFADVSYGLMPGTGEETYFLDPSPGAANGGVTTSNPPQQIVINEIMYHPATENDAEEFIEIYNRGDVEVDLAGWSFTNGVDYTFPPGTTIAAGAYLAVAADATAFTAAYGAVPNLIGDWIDPAVPDTDQRLSNSSEQIVLRNADGERIDRVTYADEGDWSVRVRTPMDHGNQGWGWADDHDGGGKSLELINVNLTNREGRNWAASLADGGTPGVLNSVADTDVAPLVRDVDHWPIVPNSADPVTITADLLDELATGLAATLFWRLDQANNTAPFIEVPMLDDGLSGDGLAGDGTFAATIPAQANGSIIEFYVRAADTAGNTRTWPAPARSVDGASTSQAANLLYQVDDAFDADYQPGDQREFRLIMTEDERAQLAIIGDADFSTGDQLSDAQMNGTFISFDGVDLKKRYQVGIRNRGHNTRRMPPMNYRVNIPQDDTWNGLTALNINTKYTDSQVIGAAVFQSAGIPTANAEPVQVRVNGADLSESGSRMFGTYVYVEALNGEWADNHFSGDGDGNLYRAVAGSGAEGDQADLLYLGEDPAAYDYDLGGFYRKNTNASQYDWSDLIDLTDALNGTPPETFVAEIAPHVNIEQWVNFLAVDNLLGNKESGLNWDYVSNGNGRGDDYALYRGVTDPRFLLIPHDLDSVLGLGNSGSAYEYGIFNFEDVNGLYDFANHPDVVPLYYEALLRHAATTFSPEVIGDLVDKRLGDVAGDGALDWVSATRIAAIKTFAENRRQYVLSLIPQTLTVESPLPLEPVAGRYYYTTDPTASLSGQSHAALTRSVLVNGVEADWDARRATWSAAGVALNGGVNRVLVEAFDGKSGTGDVIDTRFVDVWYDTGGGSVGASYTIPAGSAWYYLDDGSDQGTAWREVGFTHAWDSGPAQLGYGDNGDEATVVGYIDTDPGLAGTQKNATTYFRREFTLPAGEAAKFTDLTIRLLRDDAASVYVNGTEVIRDRLPGVLGDAQIQYDTFSNQPAVGGAAEDTFYTFSADPSLLQDGPNVIAVEIHQAADSSSDISFDLEMTATETVQGGETLLAGTLSGDTTLTAADSPYHVTADVTVPAGATLTIEPGTTLYFDPNTQITVNGIIQAVGTKYGRIRFTSVPGAAFVPDIRPQIPDGPPKWDGIRLSGTMSDANIIAYADFEYAQDAGGSIGAINSEILIDNVSFFGTRLRMVYTNASSLTVRNSIFPDMFEPGDSPLAMTPVLDNVSEQIKGDGSIPAGGHYIIDGNVLGTNKGHNDVVDVSSPQLPGPTMQIINNVFLGAGDEAIDGGGDFLVEGNLFMNFIKDRDNNGTGDSNVISTSDGGTTVLMATRNTFVNIDHTVNFKTGAYGYYENNTVVGITAPHLSLDTDTPIRMLDFSAINYLIPNESDPANGPPRDYPPGRGTYTAGNIFYDIPQTVFGNVDFANPFIDPSEQFQILEVRDTLVPASSVFDGADGQQGRVFGFTVGDPRFVDVDGGDYRLGPGSPALGTGPNGLDMGAIVPAGASISGEPPVLTALTDATLTIGGPGIFSFAYKINDGPWMPEIQIGDPRGDKDLAVKVRTYELPLTGLADGDYTVYVRGRNFAGVMQAEADAAVSRTWTVDQSMSRVVINEVLAHNVGTLDVAGTRPDLIELYNDGGATVDLSGMGITDNPNNPQKFLFPAGTQLAPGEYLTLYADSALGQPGELHTGFSLSSTSGEGVWLYDTMANNVALLDSIEFGVQLPDLSIGRVGQAGSWALNVPTIGAANVEQPTGDPALLKINEWFTNGQYTIDAVIRSDDFVELYNGDDRLPVALGGLYLTDDPVYQPDKHQLPPLSFIAAGGYAVFAADGRNDRGDHVDFALDPYYGWIALLDAGLNEIDKVLYGPQTSGVSQGRVPDGGAEYRFFAQPTPALDSSAPSTPANLRFTLLTGTQIDVAWDASSDPQSGVAYYKVYRDGAELTITADTFYSDLGVTAGEVYSYQVSAVNGDGIESGLSDALASGIDTSPPSVPANLTGVIAGDSRADLAWDASIDPQSGVDYYTVYRGGVEIGTTTTPNFSDTAVTLGNMASYAVTATNGDGAESGNSADLELILFQNGLYPQAGYAGTADTWLNENGAGQSANYGTSGVLEIDGEDPLETLTIIRWDLTGIPADATVTGVSFSANATNESPQTYEIYALERAWNELQATWLNAADGQPWETPGARGATDRGTTVLGTIVASPVGRYTFTLNAAGIAQVQQWVDDPASNYGLIFSDDNNTNGVVLNSSDSGTAANRPRLNVMYRQIVDETPPTVPQSVQTSDDGVSNITVDWDVSSDPESGVDHYVVYRDAAEIGTVPGNQVSLVDAGRVPGVDYAYTVAAVNGQGLESLPSDPPAVHSIAVDATPPSVPAGLAAVDDGASQVTLTWNASVDAESGVDHYVVYRDTAEIGTVPGNQVSLVDAGRVPGVDYAYTVAAVNGQGLESLPSDPPLTHTIAVDTTGPTAPQNLAATDDGASRITLTWSAASDAESGIAGYTIFRDDVEIATVTGTTFTDAGRLTAVTYSYRVAAVNGQSLEGPSSAAIPYEITPAEIRVNLLTRDSYLPGVPVLVRVELVDQSGDYQRDVWDATATLTTDDPNVVLSTGEVTLYNGLGSALVTFSGGTDFTLTAAVGAMQSGRAMATLAGQPETAVSGTLSDPSGTTTWSGIVHVTGDLTVPDGQTLNIEPGTLVLVDGDPTISGTAGVDIIVNGSVQSLGTPARPITITAADPAAPWGWIRHDAAEPSTYQYTSITRAGHSPQMGHTATGPAVRAIGSQITFDYATISDIAGKTMQTNDSDLTFRNTQLARSVMGPEISGTALLFEDSYITDMLAIYHDENIDNDNDSIYLHTQQPGQEITLRDSVFANGGDDAIDTAGATILVENAIIRDWFDKGLSVNDGVTTLSRSIVVRNDIGIETKVNGGGTSATSYIDRSTLVDNVNGVRRVTVGAADIQVYVTNSIVRGTDVTLFDDGVPGNVSVDYTNLGPNVQWTGTGIGNTADDPLFVDAAANDYRLTEPGSPAIDAGDPAGDLWGNPDPDGTRLDMGALPTTQQYDVKHTPYLQLGDAPLTGQPGSDTDQIEIMWQTESVGQGTLDSFKARYRQLGSILWLDAGPIATLDTGVDTAQGNRRINHSVTIDGLFYDVEYEYQIQHLRGDNVLSTFESTFLTRLGPGNPDAFTFAAYGDSAQGNPPADFISVQNRINQADPAFVLLLGDNAYGENGAPQSAWGSHDSQDLRFDPDINPATTAYNASHVEYLGMGNAELETAGGQASRDNYSVPLNGPADNAGSGTYFADRPEHDYSFDYGNVHFATFDSNSFYQATGDPARLADQMAWLAADLAASDAPWKVVYAHHPAIATDSGLLAESTYYEDLISTLNAAGADLVLFSHSHSYQRSYPLTGYSGGQPTFVVDDDNDYAQGTGVVQVIAGTGGAPLGGGDLSGDAHLAAGFTTGTTPASEFGFAQIDVVGNQLTVSYIAADDGAVLDSFTITGTAPTPIPAQTLPTGETVWDGSAGPLRVTGNIVVPDDATLTITPGTNVYFNPGVGISLSGTGRLVAEGTPYERISLSSLPGSTQQWAGLQFNGTMEDNRLTYADMSNAMSRNNGIYVLRSRLTIDNVVWSEMNGRIIELNEPAVIISNSVIPEVTAGEPIQGSNGIAADGYLILDGNIFGQTYGNNDTVDFYGGARTGPMLTVVNNVFFGGPDEALDLDLDAYIEGNVFMNNREAQDAPPANGTTAAISTGQYMEPAVTPSELWVVRNIFYNVDYAVGVKHYTFVNFIQNTVVTVGRDVPPDEGAVLNFYDPSRQTTPGAGALVENNIFWDVKRVFGHVDASSAGPGTVTTDLTLNYSLIPDGLDPAEIAGLLTRGVGNVVGDPMFVDPRNDFHLLPGSPAIDAADPSKTDADGTRADMGFYYEPFVPSTVAGRYVFYNDSAFDGNGPAAGVDDDAAIATDKSALLPGATATLANVTNYSGGINGVMIDVENLPAGASITAADFAFRAGNSNDLGAWTVVADPNEVTVRPGPGGTSRITLVWDAADAVTGGWLEVTFKASTNTGLAGGDDVFYFGNAVGEVGNSTANMLVNAADVVAARDNPRGPANPATVTNAHDVNRDGAVDAADLVLIRDNASSPISALRPIAPPAAAPVQAAPSGEGASAVALNLAFEALVHQDGTVVDAARTDVRSIDSLLASMATADQPARFITAQRHHEGFAPVLRTLATEKARRLINVHAESAHVDGLLADGSLLDTL